MRCFLLLLALWCGANRAIAQSATPAASPEAMRPLASAPDTAAAIHRLFAAKRHQSGIVIGGTVFTGLLSLLVAENTRHGATIEPTPILATGISLLSIPATVAEIGYYRQFTRRKEARALGAFKEHNLPSKIKQQLRPVYFEADQSR